MFRDNRKRVITSNSEGKTEKSRGSVLNIDTIRIIRAKLILKVSRISSRDGFIGIIIIMTIHTTSKATNISLLRPINWFRNPTLSSIDFLLL